MCSIDQLATCVVAVYGIVTGHALMVEVSRDFFDLLRWAVTFRFRTVTLNLMAEYCHPSS